MSDVLIVGAGSAGSVLAEQLTTDPDCRVTVIEAGPALTDPAVRALTDDATALPIEEPKPARWTSSSESVTGRRRGSTGRPIRAIVRASACATGVSKESVPRSISVAMQTPVTAFERLA